MKRKLDKLEALLVNKSYSELLPEEREWIDQEYSAEEYDAMRHTMIESTVLFKKGYTRPNPEIKSKLHQRLKQNHEPAKLAPLFLYRIPAWQAVAAFALLLFFIPQIQSKQVNDPEKVFIYRTDTVFKEIPVENIISPIIDTLTGIPKVKKIFNRTNRSPLKSSTVVFSKDASLSANLSNDISEYFANAYDSVSIERIISRYLKDSVKSYRVDVDTEFQDMGRVY